MNQRAKRAKDAVLAAINAATNTLSVQDYKDFLDWLGSEVVAREEGLKEDERNEE